MEENIKQEGVNLESSPAVNETNLNIEAEKRDSFKLGYIEPIDLTNESVKKESFKLGYIEPIDLTNSIQKNDPKIEKYVENRKIIIGDSLPSDNPNISAQIENDLLPATKNQALILLENQKRLANLKETNIMGESPMAEETKKRIESHIKILQGDKNVDMQTKLDIIEREYGTIALGYISNLFPENKDLQEALQNKMYRLIDPDSRIAQEEAYIASKNQIFNNVFKGGEGVTEALTTVAQFGAGFIPLVDATVIGASVNLLNSSEVSKKYGWIEGKSFETADNINRYKQFFNQLTPPQQAEIREDLAKIKSTGNYYDVTGSIANTIIAVTNGEKDRGIFTEDVIVSQGTTQSVIQALSVIGFGASVGGVKRAFENFAVNNRSKVADYTAKSIDALSIPSKIFQDKSPIIPNNANFTNYDKEVRFNNALGTGEEVGKQTENNVHIFKELINAQIATKREVTVEDAKEIDLVIKTYQNDILKQEGVEIVGSKYEVQNGIYIATQTISQVADIGFTSAEKATKKATESGLKNFTIREDNGQFFIDKKVEVPITDDFYSIVTKKTRDDKTFNSSTAIKSGNLIESTISKEEVEKVLSTENSYTALKLLNTVQDNAKKLTLSQQRLLNQTLQKRASDPNFDIEAIRLKDKSVYQQLRLQDDLQEAYRQVANKKDNLLNVAKGVFDFKTENGLTFTGKEIKETSAKNVLLENGNTVDINSIKKDDYIFITPEKSLKNEQIDFSKYKNIEGNVDNVVIAVKKNAVVKSEVAEKIGKIDNYTTVDHKAVFILKDKDGDTVGVARSSRDIFTLKEILEKKGSIGLQVDLDQRFANIEKISSENAPRDIKAYSKETKNKRSAKDIYTLDSKGNEAILARSVNSGQSEIREQLNRMANDLTMKGYSDTLKIEFLNKYGKYTNGIIPSELREEFLTLSNIPRNELKELKAFHAYLKHVDNLNVNLATNNFQKLMYKTGAAIERLNESFLLSKGLINDTAKAFYGASYADPVSFLKGLSFTYLVASNPVRQFTLNAMYPLSQLVAKAPMTIPEFHTIMGVAGKAITQTDNFKNITKNTLPTDSTVDRITTSFLKLYSAKNNMLYAEGATIAGQNEARTLVGKTAQGVGETVKNVYQGYRDTYISLGFQPGETFNLATHYSIAAVEYAKKNGIKLKEVKFEDPKVANELMVRAKELSDIMSTQILKPAYATGMLSVFTQYMSVGHKMAASVLPQFLGGVKTATGTEKALRAMAYVTTFGIEGITNPHIARLTIEATLPPEITQDPEYQEAIKWVQFGIMTNAYNSAFNENLNLSQTFGSHAFSVPMMFYISLLHDNGSDVGFSVLGKWINDNITGKVENTPALGVLNRADKAFTLIADIYNSKLIEPHEKLDLMRTAVGISGINVKALNEKLNISLNQEYGFNGGVLGEKANPIANVIGVPTIAKTEADTDFGVGYRENLITSKYTKNDIDQLSDELVKRLEPIIKLGAIDLEKPENYKKLIVEINLMNKVLSKDMATANIVYEKVFNKLNDKFVQNSNLSEFEIQERKQLETLKKTDNTNPDATIYGLNLLINNKKTTPELRDKLRKELEVYNDYKNGKYGE